MFNFENTRWHIHKEKVNGIRTTAVCHWTLFCSGRGYSAILSRIGLISHEQACSRARTSTSWSSTSTSFYSTKWLHTRFASIHYYSHGVSLPHGSSLYIIVVMSWNYFFYLLRAFCPHLGNLFFVVVFFTTFRPNFTSGLLQVVKKKIPRWGQKVRNK